jgi:ADP-heptose:LPS heptosyltransferase
MGSSRLGKPELTVGRPGQPATFAADCLHWLGSEPCPLQRAADRPSCAGCRTYHPTAVLPVRRAARPYHPQVLRTAGRIGLVEMGGLGSHLRATAVTRALRLVNPAAEVHWFTHTSGAELLRHVPGVLPVDLAAGTGPLLARSLDVLLNFEISPLAAELCAVSRCVGGFSRSPQGRLVAASGHAHRLQRLQIDDAFRGAFTGTMQEVLLEAVGLAGPPGYDIVLAPSLIAGGRQLIADAFDGTAPSTVVGLNVGSSGQGRLKRWPAASWGALASLLARRHAVVILSGPADGDMRAEVAAGIRSRHCVVNGRVRFVGDVGIGEYLAVVSRLQAVVTADTFGLHAARAQRVPVVALVGPMPAGELELSAADRLVGPTLTCAPCYHHCRQPVAGACMRLITPGQVAGKVAEVLGGVGAVPRRYRSGGGRPRSGSAGR